MHLRCCYSSCCAAARPSAAAAGSRSSAACLPAAGRCTTHLYHPPSHLQQQQRRVRAAAAAAEEASAQQQPGDAAAARSLLANTGSRRALLLRGGSVAALLLAAGGSPAAWAAAAAAPGSLSAAANDELERQLPGAPPAQQQELPKAYARTMRRLAAALRESIEAEAGGAKEFEVRRRADGAKELVKEFVGKWQGNPDVAGHPSHDEMRDAISELGRFYQAAGPRARLSGEAQASVLAHLSAVTDALPPEEKSLLGF